MSNINSITTQGTELIPATMTQNNFKSSIRGIFDTREEQLKITSIKDPLQIKSMSA
jgi:hypothetical protein